MAIALPTPPGEKKVHAVVAREFAQIYGYVWSDKSRKFHRGSEACTLGFAIQAIERYGYERAALALAIVGPVTFESNMGPARRLPFPEA